VPIAIALIDRGPGSEPPAQTTAPSATASSVGPTAGASSASALTGPPSPTNPVTSQSSASLTSPVYLTDLDYSTADDDNYVEVGLASIAGKRYKKSFRVAECMSPEITVVIPTGLTQLTGVVGYDDECGSKMVVIRFKLRKPPMPILQPRM
jgi:hypothetical protein